MNKITSFLNVYGKRGNGSEIILFRGLTDAPGCIKQSKRTATSRGYTITRAERITNYYEPLTHKSARTVEQIINF